MSMPLPTGGGRPGYQSYSILKILYGYAFKFPVDEETYFFKESDYYTLKLKKKERTDGSPRGAGARPPHPFLHGSGRPLLHRIRIHPDL